MTRTIIIAEVGVNHNGKLPLAKKLITAASKAGADFVKFQTFETDQMIKKNTSLATYQKKNSSEHLSQNEMLKKYQLNKHDYKILINFAKKNRIRFTASAFDISSISFLKKLKLEFIKIPSGEIDNYQYLKEVGKLRRKVILSTGMSTMKEIISAIKVLRKFGTKQNQITILHCHTDYPSKPKNLNLNSIKALKEKFNIKIGYSDHSLGIEAPIVAVALGAEVIEKHLTLDKKMKGPDHIASIEPDEFKKMVLAIRKTEVMLGDGKKIPTKDELKNRKLVRKSLVAKIDIRKGQFFSEKNLTAKRPALGKSPMFFNKILNTKSKKDYKKDEFI